MGFERCLCLSKDNCKDFVILKQQDCCLLWRRTFLPTTITFHRTTVPPFATTSFLTNFLQGNCQRDTTDPRSHTPARRSEGMEWENARRGFSPVNTTTRIDWIDLLNTFPLWSNLTDRLQVLENLGIDHNFIRFLIKDQRSSLHTQHFPRSQSSVAQNGSATTGSTII